MTKKLILLVLAFILFTACGNLPAPNRPASTLPVIQVTPPNIAAPAQPVQQSLEAPVIPTGTLDISPENTVRLFLAAYENDTATMTQYMTPNLQAKVPADGPRAILEASGPLQGYLIRAGRLLPDKQNAEVEVGLVVDEVEITRGFILVMQHGTWLIDRIDFKNN